MKKWYEKVEYENERKESKENLYKEHEYSSLIVGRVDLVRWGLVQKEGDV